MNAISFYRFARYIYQLKIPLIPKIIKGLIFLVFNSVVPYNAIIGDESKFAYGGIGVVIHSKAVIGRRVIIGQNVTIGRKIDPEGVPIIGNDVYIAAGARIIGDITIGNNVIIGANSVVVKNVPDNCIVTGVPAKYLKSIDGNIYDSFKNIY